MSNQFMRLFVFFDLPVTTKDERRNYAQFRKFLVKDGYDMIQFSVYCRLCNGNDAVDKHLKRLDQNLPPKGSVRALRITDKQYGTMKILVGTKTIHEEQIYEQLVLDF